MPTIVRPSPLTSSELSPPLKIASLVGIQTMSVPPALKPNGVFGCWCENSASANDLYYFFGASTVTIKASVNVISTLSPTFSPTRFFLSST